MQLSLSLSCHLCASPSDGIAIVDVYSDQGKRDNLEVLLKQYISPFIFLPKVDRLCVCDTCRARLQSWDNYIESCKKAHEKLKECRDTQKTVDAVIKKRDSTFASLDVDPSISFLKKKRSSNYCIAKWCNKGNHQGISLFRLPRERDRALKWLAAAERTDLQCMNVLHSYYLCANHFTPNMFTNRAFNQLIKRAVPTVFPRPPYADRKSAKAAAFQSMPSQFKGVQLKSILPKTSKSSLSSLPSLVTNTTQNVLATSKNLTCPLDSILFSVPPQWSKGKACLEAGQNSNLVIKVISSKVYTDASTCRDVSSPENAHLNSSLNSSCVISDGFPASSECVTSLDNIIKSPIKQVACKQKVYIEELESCFTSDTLNSNTMSSTDHVLSTDVSSSQTDEMYKSTVGSQDFLLPHASMKIDKAPSSFTLRSDAAQDDAKRGSADMTATSNVSLFDLHTDDTQVASSFINNMENLDELMDLDQYFEGR